MLCIFAGKFTKFIWIMQQKQEQLSSVGLLSYYNDLSRKEQVKLKNYVSRIFNLSYYTVDAKFRGKTNFSAAELFALQPVINDESWRK